MNYPPKVICPKTAEIIHRTRLFSALDKAREQAKIIWIAAPGGSGKTTLVSSYIEKKKIANCWYQIDEDDQNLTTFFHYLGLAGKLAAPRRKKSIPKLAPEFQQETSAFTRQFFKDISSRLKNDGIIVFDNFQLLADTGPIPNLLPKIVDSLTSGVCLLIISRHLPPPSMVSFAAKRQLQVIDTKQIRFSKNEWLAASQLLASKHSNEMLLSLHKKLDGWISGLVLLPETPNKLSHANTNSLGIEILDTYIAEQFLTSLDKDSSELLMKVCYLPHISLAAAKAISHIPHAKKLLSKLAQRNLFVLEQGSKGYTLNPLIREYLIQRNQDSLSEQALFELRMSTAMALLAEKKWEPASDLLHELNAWQTLVNVILNYADKLYDTGRIESLQRYINALPQRFTAHEPWIAFWQGKLSGGRDVIAALDFFDSAYSGFLKKSDTKGIYMSWYSAVTIICNTLLGGNRLVEWVHRYNQFSVQFPTLPQKLQKGFIDAVLLQSYYCSGLDSETRSSLQARIACTIDNINDPASHLHMMSNYVHVAVLSGITTRDKAILDKFESRLNEVKDDPVLYLSALTFCSLGAGSFNDFNKVLSLESRALEVAKENGISIFNYHIYAKTVVAALGLNKKELAQKYLNQMKDELPEKNPINQSLYLMSMIAMNTYLKDTVGLDRKIKHHINILKDIHFPPFVLHIKLYYLYYLSVSNQQEEALSLHHDLLTKIKQLDFPAQSSRFYMIYAKIYFDNNERERSDFYLNKGLGIARQAEIITYANWHPDLVVWACQRAIFLKIEISYVNDFIKNHYANLPKPTLNSEYHQWPWPFRVYTFGGFELKIENGDNHQRQLTSKSLMLFKLLVKAQGGYITNDAIKETLYGDDNNEKTSQLLDTQIHRLRKLLNNEQTILRQGNRVKLHPKYFWVDVHEFEMLGKQKINKENALTTIRRLQFLYRGEYLPEDETIEAIAQRERYRNIFLATLFNCLSHIDKESRHAVEYCQNALVLEPLSEPLYRKLITIYLKQGNRDMAEATLNQCRNLLKQYLDSDISQETLSLLRPVELS